MCVCVCVCVCVCLQRPLLSFALLNAVFFCLSAAEVVRRKQALTTTFPSLSLSLSLALCMSLCSASRLSQPHSWQPLPGSQLRFWAAATSP